MELRKNSIVKRRTSDEIIIPQKRNGRFIIIANCGGRLYFTGKSMYRNNAFIVSERLRGWLA